MTRYDRLLCAVVRWIIYRLLQRRFSEEHGRVFWAHSFTSDPKLYVDRRRVGGVIIGFGTPNEASGRLAWVRMSRDMLERLGTGLDEVLAAQDRQYEEVRRRDESVFGVLRRGDPDVTTLDELLGRDDDDRR